MCRFHEAGNLSHDEGIEESAIDFIVCRCNDDSFGVIVLPWLDLLDGG